MGDGGALLLGLLMAASTMSVGGRTTAEFSGQAFFFFAPIFIPLVILGVPLLDTAWAVLRRTIRGKSPFSTADKEHLHHRLMNLGHGHRRAVIILWTWTVLLSALVLYPTYTGEGDAVVPIGIAALALVLGPCSGLASAFGPPRCRSRATSSTSSSNSQVTSTGTPSGKPMSSTSSEMSSLWSRMQPLETLVPRDAGSFVPWMPSWASPPANWVNVSL
jgi:UDP-GlcNAc:undecaprenyl-phosphate GlcNAc-1-phosphate transferase